jgi:hypothetical protein
MDLPHPPHRTTPNDAEAVSTDVDPRLVEMLYSALAVVARQEQPLNGVAPARPDKPPEEMPREKKHDDGVPLFWRLCSATVVSITALVAVTLYNQLSASVNSLRSEITVLRTELNALRDRANNDLVKKEDHNQRLLATAALIEKAQASTKASLEAWRERNQEQEKSTKSALSDLKQQLREMQIENQQLRERLASVETREGSTGNARPKKTP